MSRQVIQVGLSRSLCYLRIPSGMRVRIHPSRRARSFGSLALLAALGCSADPHAPAPGGAGGSATDGGDAGTDASAGGTSGTGGARGPDGSAGADGSTGATGGSGAGGGDASGNGGSTGSGGAGGSSAGGAASGGAGGDAATGTGGTPGTGSTCDVPVTFACSDLCDALMAEPFCRLHLEWIASLAGSPLPTDGGVPTNDALRAVCGCYCEHTYRTTYCRSDFDAFVICGTSPLTAVCPSDPSRVAEFPQIVGPCGSARATVMTCLAP